MRKVLALSILLAILIIGFLFWRQTRPRPLVVSGFIEADQIRVGSRVGGRVAEVFVTEGQHVKPNDPLFRIEPFDLTERLARAQAETAAYQAEYDKLAAGFRPEDIEQARARRQRLAATLDKLIAGPRPREIEIAEARLRVAQANLDLAETEQKRLAALASQGTASQTEVDRANRELKTARAEFSAAEEELALLKEGTRQEEIAEARASLAEAQAALALMEKGYRPEEIAQAAARLAAAQAEAAAIQVQLAELTVRAPADLLVEAIELQPGDIVAANAPAVSLLEVANLYVRTYIPESALGRVKLGSRVPIRVDSFPDRPVMARITFISADAEFTPRNIQTPEERSRQVFRTKLTLEGGQPDLRVGMAGDVLFEEATGP